MNLNLILQKIKKIVLKTGALSINLNQVSRLNF